MSPAVGISGRLAFKASKCWLLVYIYIHIYIYDCVVLWLQSPHLAVVVVVIAVNALGFGSQKLRLSGRVFAAGQYPFRPSPTSAFSGPTDVCAGNKLVACYYRLNRLRLDLFWGINVYIFFFVSFMYYSRPRCNCLSLQQLGRA